MRRFIFFVSCLLWTLAQASRLLSAPTLNKAEASLVKGDGYLADRQFGHAIDSYQNALKYDPDNRKAYLEIAFCLRALGKGTEADRYEAIADKLPKTQDGIVSAGSADEETEMGSGSEAALVPTPAPTPVKRKKTDKPKRRATLSSRPQREPALVPRAIFLPSQVQFSRGEAPKGFIILGGLVGCATAAGYFSYAGDQDYARWTTAPSDALKSQVQQEDELFSAFLVGAVGFYAYSLVDALWLGRPQSGPTEASGPLVPSLALSQGPGRSHLLVLQWSL